MRSKEIYCFLIKEKEKEGKRKMDRDRDGFRQ